MPPVFRSLLIYLTFASAAAAANAPQPPANESRAVMTSEQVVEILDKTVDWYRTLGTQQQAATQPSDLLILYANRQTADKVTALAFEIARANAELLSSDASQAQAANPEGSVIATLDQSRKKLDEQRAGLLAQIQADQAKLPATPRAGRAALQERIAVLRGELDLINAQRNLLANMSSFAGESDTNGLGANALKAHIDAIAASIPTASTATPAATAATTTASGDNLSGSGGGLSLSEFGIWDLSSTVLRLRGKMRTIESVDRRTAELQEVFTQIRLPPQERLKALGARGDALSARSIGDDAAALKGVRDQYDTLAWLFQQTAAMVTPLSKVEVLLSQYRRNLGNWREAVDKQYGDALSALGLRLAVFVGLLAIVFGAAELWRRMVFRYVHEARRRSRFLLLRKILIWCLVLALAASTFATELGSLATFAGLITAGLAVAMQSVLISVVGYFFLIGKYGVRVGDRVQIGQVTGEIVDLGLVRLHLMELVAQVPTGRVVAFANSVVFQASGGLFKQIPGIDLTWHEITVTLPPGADHEAMKTSLVQAVTNVLQDYRDDILRQTQVIQKTGGSGVPDEARPQVQLRFSAASIDAVVRYPVQRVHAAEIDERVSREILRVTSQS
ncbi:MAG: mechanosensitive ion channel family protein [Steroidobacteraceae bacterium]